MTAFCRLLYTMYLSNTLPHFTRKPCIVWNWLLTTRWKFSVDIQPANGNKSSSQILQSTSSFLPIIIREVIEVIDYMCVQILRDCPNENDKEFYYNVFIYITLPHWNVYHVRGWKTLQLLGEGGASVTWHCIYTSWKLTVSWSSKSLKNYLL